MRSPRKRTWFCSTSMVAPSREVKEAGLFELSGDVNRKGKLLQTQNAHKINDRIDVFPLPDAPMRSTWHCYQL